VANMPFSYLIASGRKNSSAACTAGVLFGTTHGCTPGRAPPPPPAVDSHVGNLRALLIQGKQQAAVRPLCDAKLVEGAEPLTLPHGFVAALGVARGLHGPPHLHCDIFDGVARAVFLHGHKRVAARSRVLDFVR
jgi:hypothetical protein